ncbi:hypothetical protein [Edaphobacter aggregans]|uniref:hypothetical protein n=1 Tax=Edaphobacter aggregans TaxID=570835 RepID=UPI0012F8991E|nr:hypothetical protein [Edaphobacter aggregans]
MRQQANEQAEVPRVSRITAAMTSGAGGGAGNHQDLGQMLMYVNYFDRFVKLDHENSTVGNRR